MEKSDKIEHYRHSSATRANIPTAETSSLLAKEEAQAAEMKYPRNPDLDPQLVWRGKDEADAADLAVPTVPIYIQEKIMPEALIRDLRKQKAPGVRSQSDLFGSFDRLDDPEAKLEFYAHAENWSNRMILGDSLLVMNSLAEKEGLRGQVQMIFFDPPYGIRFGSNWQPSTKKAEAKDRSLEGVTREPEQIKAFRDTWKDGINSYLGYIRDRLVVARELLTDSGSIFVQISDENLHLIRSLLDEVFGPENHVSTFSFRKKTMPFGTNFVEQMADFVVWYAKRKEDAKGRPNAKYRKLFRVMEYGPQSGFPYVQAVDGEIARPADLPPEAVGTTPRWCGSMSLEPSGLMESGLFKPTFRGKTYSHPTNGYGTTPEGLLRLERAGRLIPAGNLLRTALLAADKSVGDLTVPWSDTVGADDKGYVVQTNTEVVKRCTLMTTDPGDLVLDPTCGSGTTAFVAEAWGRRWITIDTSRVALAIARARLMSRPHPAHLLRDSREGAAKEAEVTGRPTAGGPYQGDLRQGFLLERVPHVTVSLIANNAEIDVIHDKWQPVIEAARAAWNSALDTTDAEWRIPRAVPDDAPKAALDAHAAFWKARRERQAAMDASIARNADVEYLHDRPYPKKGAVRVTGPFTVESLSPHRVLPADEEDEAVVAAMAVEAGEAPPPRRRLRPKSESSAGDDFVTAVLDNLAKAGVQNTKKNERLILATLRPWPGQGHVAAEATYEEAGQQRRAAIVIGPEYGTVGQDLVREAARECRDWADSMVVCGFAFDPQVGETTMNFGRLTVLKARMSQELHAADAYKSGGGNLFVVFGEPDIALDRRKDGTCVVQLRGVDIFDPTTGEVRSSGKVEEDVACWFVDTDYDGDSFFVRHAYFLGGKDPFEKLKTALKTEVDEAAWSTLYSKESRPFSPPKSGRIAVKVINHYGDEAMRVFKIG
jgi:adenine-specific DNA-methyltransferase